MTQPHCQAQGIRKGAYGWWGGTGRHSTTTSTFPFGEITSTGSPRVLYLNSFSSPLLQLPSTPAPRLPFLLTSSERWWASPFLEPELHYPPGNPSWLSAPVHFLIPAGTLWAGGRIWLSLPRPPLWRPVFSLGRAGGGRGEECTSTRLHPLQPQTCHLSVKGRNTVLFRPPTWSPDTSFSSPPQK